MADINILVVVDTKTTLAGTTTVYMEDDNPTNDTGEGTDELVANVNPGDKITWRATSINQLDTVELTSFTDNSGATTVFKTGEPKKNTDGSSWSGTIGDYAPGTIESYTFHFSINGSGDYSWDPEIKVRET
ncbi:MAG: AidA/PixA family protein [Fulvivirga sp.]